MPLDFKKDLIEFEIMTVPSLIYGVGSNCNTIYKLNNEAPDTVNECPSEKYYHQLINRIKTNHNNK